MIDLKHFSENKEEVKKALAKKGFTGDVDAILKMDEDRRSLMHKVETEKSKLNQLAKEIAKYKDNVDLITEAKEVKKLWKDLEIKLNAKEHEINKLLLEIPNPPLESVPEGESDEDNKVERTEGTKPEFSFEPKDHVELGEAHDLFEFEAAANSSGARFWYVKNEAALLQFALVQYVLNKLVQKGFSPVVPPVLVREQAMEATGFFPADRNEIYSVNPDEDDLYLTGTSEVSLCMLNADKILKPDQLPIRICGYSTCFRREAGTYGKDTSGIFRGHQFDKIEMFSYVHPSKSEEEHEKILKIEEEIMQDLGFHYQVVNICGGDMGAPAAKKYDLEVWIPSQKKYRELTSCSNCTDFQARRAKIRFQDNAGKTFVHTLNGTAIAIGRTLIAILENYQQKDGTIKIPKVLQPYMIQKEQIG